MALVTRLLSQGSKVKHLSNTFEKSYDRQIYQVGQYKKNAYQIFIDPISLNDLHFSRLSIAKSTKLVKLEGVLHGQILLPACPKKRYGI